MTVCTPRQPLVDKAAAERATNRIAQLIRLRSGYQGVSEDDDSGVVVRLLASRFTVPQQTPLIRVNHPIRKARRDSEDTPGEREGRRGKEAKICSSEPSGLPTSGGVKRLSRPQLHIHRLHGPRLIRRLAVYALILTIAGTKETRSKTNLEEGSNVRKQSGENRYRKTTSGKVKRS